MPHTTKQGMKTGKSKSRLPQALIPFANDFDAKIAASFFQMRHWCEERNRACSATRDLPAEVLSMIFGQLADSQGTRSTGLDDLHTYRAMDTGRPQWLEVIYVCRQWRMAALSDPSLWCDLTRVEGRWLERFVTLAKVLPLVFHYSVLRPSEDATKEALLCLPERLGELTITHCTDEFIGRLNEATPFLSALCLVAFSFQGGAFSIPDDFLGGSAPMLRSFHLCSGILPSNPTWLSNVQILTLRGLWAIKPATSGPAKLTLCSLLELIRPLEALTELDVDLYKLRDPSANKYTGPKISFPRLRSLAIGLSPDPLRCIRLLQHIETPSLKTLSVMWPYDCDADTEGMEDDAVDAINKIYKFYAKNTRSSPSRLDWRANELDSDIVIASSSPACKLTLANVPLALDSMTIPFGTLENIRSIVIGFPEFLHTLDSMSGVVDPWPYLERVEVMASALIPKNRGLPALKRWLKSRPGVRNLKIRGVESLSEKDVQPLYKIVDVKWVKGGS